MSDPAARLLRLLSLLQGRQFWTGSELAHRLSVTERTVRRDVDRLRGLGYPVDASVGVAGGYQLGSGASLPPLLLEDDEALAVTLGLRMAAAGSIAGIEDATLRALAKLEQVLPSRLRRKVRTLNSAVASVYFRGPTVDAQVLATLAGAQRARETVVFAYATVDGTESERHAEPHGLVNAGTRWYLLAWDKGREDWRTFRVDRIRGAVEIGEGFTPRAIPGGDAARFVSRAVSTEVYPVQARVIFHASRDVVAARVPPSAAQIDPLDEQSCLMRTGARDVGFLAMHLANVGVEFEVLEPPELIEEVRMVAQRLSRAGRRSQRKKRA
jgi:predicted DNA-binding transcriptional regulator YafY